MSCKVVTINNSNVVQLSNQNAWNQYRLIFKNGGIRISDGASMSINEAIIPYSFPNVSSQIGDNYFWYTIPSVTTTFNSVISGTTLTVSSISASNLVVGSIISYAGIPNATSLSNYIYITALGTGSGGNGTYTISQAITQSSIATTSNQNLYSVNLPNGFYTVPQINAALQAQMFINGHYWYYTNPIQTTASIVTTTLTLTTGSAATLPIGASVSGYNVTPGTIITAQTGALTYTLNNSNTLAASSPILVSNNTDITSQIIYPLTISVYPQLYTNQISAVNIPSVTNIQSVFGIGWSQANGLNGQNTWLGTYPTSNTIQTCAQLVIPQGQTNMIQNGMQMMTMLIGNILGFTSGSYPTVSYNLSGISQTVYGNTLTITNPYPSMGSMVNGIIVHCNAVENVITNNTDILGSFPINTTYGSNITFQASTELQRVKMKSGNYQSIDIYFTDQNNNPLQMLDYNILLSLSIFSE